MEKKDLNGLIRIWYNEQCKTIRKRLRKDLREHNTMRVEKNEESIEEKGCNALLPVLQEVD